MWNNEVLSKVVIRYQTAREIELETGSYFPIYVNSKESTFFFYFWVEKEITYQEKSIIKVDFKSPVKGVLGEVGRTKGPNKKIESSID